MSDPLTVGSLFSGIGGLDLGLERAGMEVVWQSEVDPFACRVLAHHWPNVPNLGDVTTIDWKKVPRVDLICGGYPCQPFSYAGNRQGDQDQRHLWPYMFDALRLLRPRYAVLENVPGHLSLGFDAVLADLADIGFDAEWSIVSACSVGASHLRRRLFVVAYPADRDGEGEVPHHPRPGARRGVQPRGSGGDPGGDRWLPEPEMGRVAVGVPSRLVRGPLYALGNSVVPQVAELVGRRVMEMAA